MKEYEQRMPVGSPIHLSPGEPLPPGAETCDAPSECQIENLLGIQVCFIESFKCLWMPFIQLLNPSMEGASNTIQKVEYFSYFGFQVPYQFYEEPCHTCGTFQEQMVQHDAIQEIPCEEMINISVSLTSLIFIIWLNSASLFKYLKLKKTFQSLK